MLSVKKSNQESISFGCHFCKRESIALTKHQKDSLRRKGYAYCSKECGKKHTAAISSITMTITNKKYASDRMKKNNPMKNLESRKKMIETLKKIGHKPKERWGNGCGLTVPQQMLMDALQEFTPVAEYPEPTKMQRESGYPSCYKIDIAIPHAKLAIEVDGGSHGSLSRKEEDTKKDILLKSLGWIVLRVSNKQVRENISETVMCITSKLREITTTSQTGY